MKWITTAIIVALATKCIKGQGFENRQVQAQGRRLVDIATFEARCDATNIPGLSGINAYVNCNEGLEVDANDNPTGQTCATACAGLCCAGDRACGIVQSGDTIFAGGFTGKGKKSSSIYAFV